MIKNYFRTLGLRHWLWRLMVGSLHTMPLFLIVMFAAEEGYIDNNPATRDLYFIVPSFFLWFVYLFVLPRLVPSKFAAKFAAQQLKNEKDYEKRQKKESTKQKQKLVDKENKRVRDIKLGHKISKTVMKIRNPITDKRIIKMEKKMFCDAYTVKYMPTLLHEIREELVDEMIENKVKYPRWEKFITKQYDPCLAKKEVEKDFLSGIVRAVDYPMCALLVEIMFEKLTEYFLENGWTFEVKKMKNIFDSNEELYLYPPKK